MLQQRPDLDRLFHALADPTRRAIVERLAAGPAAAGDLAQPMAMTLSAVMQHLSVLEDSRLIRTRKEGRRRICVLDEFGVMAIEDWTRHRRAQWEQRFDRLGDVIARNRKPQGEKS